jgi:hypothetical protein
MSKRKKQQRRELKQTQKRELKAEKQKKDVPVFVIPDGAKLRDEEKVQLPAKRFLIICEGPTEKSYFEGLKSNLVLSRKLSAVEIKVITQSHKKENNELIDNSLKGMIWKAMELKREEDEKNEEEQNPYDEIWIVIDNDDCNSYQITENTLNRMQNRLDAATFNQIKAYRGCCFLSKLDYQRFLETTCHITDEQNMVIQLTDKRQEFEDLNNADPTALFYNNQQFDYAGGEEGELDATWKDYINVAYSCRSFENWVILHFERCLCAFHTSKELEEDDPLNPNSFNSIHYLKWIKKYIPAYRKGEESEQRNVTGAYEGLKSKPFSVSLEENRRAVRRIETAMENSIWLESLKQKEMLQTGLHYFEVNPFSDNYRLIRSMLGKMFYSIDEWNNKVNRGIELSFELSEDKTKIKGTIKNLHPTKRIFISPANFNEYFKLICIEGDNRKEIVNNFHLQSDTINTHAEEHPIDFQISLPTLHENNDYCIHFLVYKLSISIPVFQKEQKNNNVDTLNENIVIYPF